jgi:hypothetical protein
MKIHQLQYINSSFTEQPSPNNGFNQQQAQIVLSFLSPEILQHDNYFAFLEKSFPAASLIHVVTSGEILGDENFDNSASITAMTLEKSDSLVVNIKPSDYSSEKEVAQSLYKKLFRKDICAIMLLVDGLSVNSGVLLDELNILNITNVPIVGGIAGDNAAFQSSWVGLNEKPSAGNLIAVGFYGNHLKIGHGSLGGWDVFGPERMITKSKDNVLFEIDQQSALGLYKQYLGPYQTELPGSALLFPLAIFDDAKNDVLVRTILSIDESTGSMHFAGNLPEGARVRLMKANFERIIDASGLAATRSNFVMGDANPDLAILISCVGRKLILQHRTFEEVLAARQFLGDKTAITGFYSHGEISPMQKGASCELHNQTMTITTFKED